MAKALKTREASIPRQAGERARLKVIQGPDVGAIFVLTMSPVNVGRGDENELTLMDLKASRKHFELAESPAGWVMQDAGSANGTLLNGVRAASGPVRTGDLLQIGETILEFMGQDTPTVMLTAPPRDLAQLQSENAQFDAQRRKVQAQALGRPVPASPSSVSSTGNTGALTSILSKLGGFAQSAASVANAAKAGGSAPSPEQTKRIVMYGGLAVLVGWLYLSEPSAPSGAARARPRAKTTTSESVGDRGLAAYTPQDESDPKAKQAAEIFFRDGFREYSRKNYLRARTHFETALQVDPSHPQARRFLEESEDGIRKLVKTHLRRGKRNMDTGRLRDARVDYETVLRTLYREPTTPEYLEASDLLEKVKRELRATNTSTVMGGGN